MQYINVQAINNARPITEFDGFTVKNIFKSTDKHTMAQGFPKENFITLTPDQAQINGDKIDDINYHVDFFCLGNNLKKNTNFSLLHPSWQQYLLELMNKQYSQHIG